MVSSPSLSVVTLAVLPDGLVLPPLPYLVALLVAVLAVGGWLSRREPAVTGSVVVAFAPWMATGAALHVLYQLDAAPSVVVPLLGAPAVYVTTFVCAGGLWAGLDTVDAPIVRGLAATGIVTAVGASALVLRFGAVRDSLKPIVPVSALVGAVVVTTLAYWLLGRARPTLAARTGGVGVLVIFGHVLDGISTAVGVDLLGTGERSPLPRAIMHFADSLPTAQLLGSGWLFVVVKLGVAVAVLALFSEYVEEEPTQANVVLGFVAAVGLGPGTHNLLLFAVA